MTDTPKRGRPPGTGKGRDPQYKLSVPRERLARLKEAGPDRVREVLAAAGL